MKKRIIILFCAIVIFLIGFWLGLNLYDRHDVDRDGEITALDYIKIKKYIMEDEG